MNHGEIPILQMKGGHEHIIPDELFYTVQERLEKKRKIWEGEIEKPEQMKEEVESGKIRRRQGIYLKRNVALPFIKKSNGMAVAL